MKNENLFQRRILGLTSYFRSAQESLLPRYVLNENDDKIYHIVNCIMSDYQLGIYEKVRKAEEDNEKNKNKVAQKNIGKSGDDLFDLPSTYRIFSRAACNFVFPEIIGRPKPDKIEKEEEKDEQENELLQMKNIAEFDDDRESDDDEYQNEGQEEGVLRRKQKKQQIDNGNESYNKRIIDALNKLKDPNENYLSPEGLLKYSPKFANILTNLLDESNKGLHLLYSNFRTIEGVGILKLVLERNGYAEFKIIKNGNSWDILTRDEDKEKPKFVLYTGTESAEEKEIIRNVYNSSWDLVPNSIVKKLNQKNNVDKNMYGSVIKLLMITSSGAEGINLKNTRYVHIVEPYWNMVRLQQVIGRARRICSHEELPYELQTIKIFVYLTVFSEEQKIDDKHIELRIRDVSKKDNKTPITTDESLFELADKKDVINQQILNAVKSSAIDCKLFNKGSKENYLCYSIGKIESNDFLSLPDISIDMQNNDLAEQNFNTITRFNFDKFQFTDNNNVIQNYYQDKKNKEVYTIEDVDFAKRNNSYDDLKPIGKLVEVEGNFQLKLY
jgi:hypothetical protein